MGGGKGGGSNTTTSTQSAEPWGPQQPYLENIFGNAQNLYTNVTPSYYPGQTVAPMNYLQNAALQNVTNAALTDPFQAAPAQSLVSLMGGASLANPALGPLAGLANTNAGATAAGYEMPFLNNNAAYTYNPLTEPFINNNAAFLANATEAPFALNNQAIGAPGQDVLSTYTSGARMAAGNPYMQSLTDSIAASVVPRIQSQFVSGGMLGSPEAARSTSEGLASALAPYSFGQYAQEEQNQINAANALANRYMTGAGLQQQAASNMAGRLLTGSGMQQQAASDAVNRLMQGWGLQQSAASDIAGKYLQGAGTQGTAAANYGNLVSSGYGDILKAAALAPSVQSTWYAPSDALFAAGSAQQLQSQQDINDAVQRWNFAQQLPYNQLNQYIGQVTGNYGGTTTLTQPYFNNQGQNALSGAVGGATLGGSLLGPAGLGLTSAGAGSGIGAGLGALMMLFSDPRLKTDDEPVGKLDNGLTVHSYRYIDDPPEMRRIGLMADEVERKRPDAVAIAGPEWGALGGMRMVDYARATEPA